MKKIIMLFGILVIPILGASQQQSQSFVELENQINKIIKEHHVPGVAIALVDKDSILYASGFSNNEIEPNSKITKNTLFRVGSITKSFIAVGILKLVEEGKLNLNSKLSELIPEIEITNPWEETSPLRVVHLLEHTTGFDDMHFNEFYAPEGKKLSGRKALSINSSSRLVRWEPGTRTSYSNPGYAVAGYLLEKYSEKPFEDYLQHLILFSTGMNKSSFDFNSLEILDRPLGYVYDGDDVKPIKYKEILYRWVGSLNSTANDMGQFVRLLINYGLTDDGDQIIDKQLIERMEQTATSCAGQNGLNLGYGLGLMSSVKGMSRNYGHSGGIEGFISKYKYYRDVEMGYVMLLNIENAEAYKEIYTLLEEYIAKISNSSKREMPVFKTENNDNITGYYSNRNPRNDMLSGVTYLFNGISVISKNDTLFSKEFMQLPKALKPVSKNIYRYDGYNEGHILITHNKNGEQIFVEADQEEEYYEKSSKWLHLFILISFMASLCLAFIIIIVYLIRVITGIWVREIRGNTDIAFMSLASTSLIFIGLTFFNIKTENLYLLGQISYPSLVFFMGSILFTVFSLVGILYIWKTIGNRHGIYKYYLIITALAFVELNILFFVWNFIGKMLWV